MGAWGFFGVFSFHSLGYTRFRNQGSGLKLWVIDSIGVKQVEPISQNYILKQYRGPNRIFHLHSESKGLKVSSGFSC